MSTEKKEHISSEEPELFAEKPEKPGLGRLKIAGLVVILAAGIFLWPKGVIRGDAILQASSFSKIGLTSSGILKELFHEKGERLKKGELIARFENTGLLKEHEKQELFLEGLEEKKGILLGKKEFYGKEADRKQILYENGALSRSQLEKARLDAANAAGELAALEKEIEAALKETRYLQERVEALALKAPFDGILLTDPSDHVGSPIKEGEFVLEMADPGTFFLEILVPEKDIEKIAEGDKVKARFLAFPWKTYPGEIARIAPRATQEIEKVFKIRHVIPCEIRLLETPGALKYGMRARVSIQTKRKGIF